MNWLREILAMGCPWSTAETPHQTVTIPRRLRLVWDVQEPCGARDNYQIVDRHRRRGG